MNWKKRADSRQFQLFMMACVAFFITPFVVFFTMVIEGMPLPDSISETAAIGSPTSPILPWALGGVGWFALVYGIKYNYDLLDRIFPLCIFAGFTLVSWFPISHSLISYTPIYGLPQAVVDVVHYIGAILGFGATILWVMVCFTKSDTATPTKQKVVRNYIYKSMGIAITICITIIALRLTGSLITEFALVLWLEAVILVGIAISCAVKSGLFLRDKGEL